jgi:hypothetical protein
MCWPILLGPKPCCAIGKGHPIMGMGSATSLELVGIHLSSGTVLTSIVFWRWAGVVVLSFCVDRCRPTPERDACKKKKISGTSWRQTEQNSYTSTIC